MHPKRCLKILKTHFANAVDCQAFYLGGETHTAKKWFENFENHFEKKVVKEMSNSLAMKG